MIKAVNLDFKVKSKYLLKSIDFSCHASEFVAIVGPNGAGKSTFLSLIANEISLSDNEVIFKDCVFSLWCRKNLAQHKAKFSQSFSSDIPLLVKDVVMMGRYPYFQNTPSKQDIESVEQILRYTGLDQFSGCEYNFLSGGEKQRVHIARVLVQLQNNNKQKLLLLDEPLNNLDVKHQHSVLKTIRAFCDKGNAAIVVLHDLNLASEYAQKVVILDKGIKICQGGVKQVFTQEILSKVYQMPCQVIENPISKNPLIIFGQ
ncbi:heme ABC transporter ATP-binding protein [Myroides pelagicus]|uniref:heme ABC transporter ATP-binding protein n=1 Tax=Myroides pelagicus TaxID=270914 RepID=UPI002DB92FF0|nr:heme ABC transporter ATP-binding protein [Myroides pelagicus]MEC4115077.1 heme ABC transporter ATP-binding protein [Myroides pelagicus]